MDNNAFQDILASMQAEFSGEAWRGAVGHEFDFYGVAENQFKLEDTVWGVVEDEDEHDGYGSRFGCILICPISDHTIFSSQPIARIRVEESEDLWGYYFNLVGIGDKHQWLRFGTCYPDDNCPYFVFNYSPKEPSAAQTSKPTT